MKKSIKFALKAWLEIRDPKTGKLLLKKDNLITNGGLAIAAYQLGHGGTPLVEACVGEGTTAAANADTAMESQVDYQTPVFSRVQTAVANDTAQFVSLHTAPAGGWALTEYGIRTAADTLFNRVVFAAINLPENGQLEFTYKVQLQRV